jgi:hypothetical protein
MLVAMLPDMIDGLARGALENEERRRVIEREMRNGQ